MDTIPDRVYFLADSILETANMKGDPLFESYALLLKGDYYLHLYDIDLSMTYYMASLEKLKEHKLISEVNLIYSRIGINYLRQNNYQKAQEYALEDLELSKVLKDSAGIARAYKDIGVNYYFQGDYAQSLKYFVLARDMYNDLNLQKELATMASRLGALYYHHGHYAKAIQSMNQYLEFESESDDPILHAEVYTNIGAIYFQLKDYNKAIEFYEKGLFIDDSLNDHRGRAIGYFNIGECFLVEKELQKAMDYFQISLKISKQYNEKDIVADCYLSIGLIYTEKSEFNEALRYYKESLDAAVVIGYKAVLSRIYTARGRLYNLLSDYDKALAECQQGLDASNETGDIQDQIKACECLYITNKALDRPSDALKFHEIFLGLKDSLHNEETIRQVQRMEFDRQILQDSLKNEEEKLLVEIASEKEISKQKTRKNIFLFSGIGTLVLAAGLYSRLSYIRKSKAIIQQEKDRSEDLLLNILPSEVAEELKSKGESVARDFDEVTVLFTDFKGFTSISESLNAQDLVAEINTCFKAFDEIITAHGIEKIKTIGDAYMAAGGLHVPRTSNVKDVVLTGLEMQSFMISRKLELEANQKPFFEMRLGIHTGPVVAGIVGVKKFQYDIWGDTVNIASRMESSGEIGMVNISAPTYSYIKDDPIFSFAQRGGINAKNKGMMEMYFVSLKNQS